MKKYSLCVLVLITIICGIAIAPVNAYIVVEAYWQEFNQREVFHLLELDKDDPELAIKAEQIATYPTYDYYYSRNYPIEQRNKYIAELIEVLETLKLPIAGKYINKVIYEPEYDCLKVSFGSRSNLIEYELYNPYGDRYKEYISGSWYDCTPQQIGEISLYESKAGSDDERRQYEWVAYLQLNDYRFRCTVSRDDGEYDEERLKKTLRNAPISTIDEFMSLSADFYNKPATADEPTKDNPIDAATPETTPAEVTPGEELQQENESFLTIEINKEPVDIVKLAYCISGAVSVMAIITGVVTVVVVKRIRIKKAKINENGSDSQ